MKYICQDIKYCLNIENHKNMLDILTRFLKTLPLCVVSISPGILQEHWIVFFQKSDLTWITELIFK